MLGLWLYKVEGRRTLHFSILVWGQVREYQTPPHSLTTLRSMVMENGKTYCGHILSEHSSIDIRLVDIIIWYLRSHMFNVVGWLLYSNKSSQILMWTQKKNQKSWNHAVHVPKLVNQEINGETCWHVGSLLYSQFKVVYKVFLRKSQHASLLWY